MISKQVSPNHLIFPASQDFVRRIGCPHFDDIQILHAFVRIKDFPCGEIPDDINPRRHEKFLESTKGRVPEAIRESFEENPKWFHLLNRGCLILAEKAWYDNKDNELHIILESKDEHGMADGATTDRVLKKIKDEIKELADADNESLETAYIHLEIITGNVQDELINLTRARNTSKQVQEFSLVDLGEGFDWLKDIIEKSKFKGKIRYKENDIQPVDIRKVLSLLTIFHPEFNKEESKDPIIAYTSKESIIEKYKDNLWRDELKRLSPIVIDILHLYEYIQLEFSDQYKKGLPKGAKFGKRKEIQYYDKYPKTGKKLPLTGKLSQYGVPDGYLYPLLGSFRPLVTCNDDGSAEWLVSPFKHFDNEGWLLIKHILGQSENLGRNPNAVGKNKELWMLLRTLVENMLFKTGKKS